MKKFYAFLIFLFLFSVMGVGQSIDIWADDNSNQIISQTNVSDNAIFDFSTIDSTVVVDQNLTISDMTITIAGDSNINNIFEISSNATFTLNNVKFVNSGNANCIIYNEGKVIINNVAFDSGDDTTDILNASEITDGVILQKVQECQTIKIKLNNNCVCVNESSQIDGLVQLSLNEIAYSDLNDNYIGQVLVKGINTFAGAYISHFKFEDAPDEESLKNTTGKDNYFADFKDKYYIDYAGVIGDSINTINDGLQVSYGHDLNYTNVIDSGDIILTKFCMKLKGLQEMLSEQYSFFQTDNDGDYSYLYIGGKYATSRLFVQGLLSNGLPNCVANGLVLDMSGENGYVSKVFALDNVHSLYSKSSNVFLYSGSVGFEKIEVNISIDDELQVDYYYASLTNLLDTTYSSSVLLPIYLNGNSLQGEIEISDGIKSIDIVNNDILYLIQLDMGDSPKNTALSISLLSDTNEAVFVQTYVDNINLEYNKIDYLDTKEDGCRPYYLDEENKKCYLQSAEYIVYKVIDSQKELCSEIIDAGEYLIYLESVQDSIYYTDEPYTITVVRKQIVVDFGKTTFEYDGGYKGIEPVATNLCNGDEIIFSITNNSNIVPGKYTTKISIDNSSRSASNYVLGSTDKTCVYYIDKANITRDQIILDTQIVDGVDTDTKVVVYDGNEHTINMLNTIAGITFKCVSFTEAGEYIINPVFSRDPELYNTPELTLKLIITPQTIDLSDIEIDDIHKDYDGTPVTLQISSEILDKLPKQISKTITITGDNVSNASDEPYKVEVQFNLKQGYDASNYNILGQTKIVYIYIAKIDFDFSLLQFNDKTVDFDGNGHKIEFINRCENIVSGNVEDIEYTNCGEYKYDLKLTLLDETNYNPLPQEVVSATLTIEQKILDTSSIRFDNKIVTYSKDCQDKMEASGYADLGLDVTYTYYVDDEEIVFESVGKNGVGVYRVVASFSCSEIMFGNVAPVEDKQAYLKVNKMQIDFDQIEFYGKTFTYDKKEHMLDSATSPYNITFSYSDSAQINAGTYTIYAYPDIDSNNYEKVHYREISAVLQINKATYDMSGIKFNNINTTYDKIMKVAQIQGKLPQGVVCTYENNEQINAGNYVATAHFQIEDEDNYEKIEDMQCRIVISPKKVEVKLKQDNFVYTGNSVVLEVEVVSGILEGDNCTASALNMSAVDSGSYTTDIVLDNDNYTPSKSSLKFNITKADLDMSQISFEDVSAVYDGYSHMPKLEGDIPNGIVPNFVMGSLVNAGEYVVYVDFTVANKNYNKPERIVANVTIKKKPILVEFSGLTGLIEDGNKKDINVQFIGVIESNFDEYKKIYSKEPITAGKYTLTIELNEGSNYEILGVNSINFEILTNSKSYRDDNFQMQIAGEGFLESSEINVIQSDNNIDDKLQQEGINLVNYEVFKIVMPDENEIKNINVTLKTNSINLANAHNIKLFKIKDGNLQQIECKVYNNQIIFDANLGDELVIVEEKGETNTSTLLILALIFVVIIAMTTITIILLKKKHKKPIEHFIENK